MIDLSKYRIIDFSPELVPGETRTNGHHENGDPFRGRWIEVQEVEALGARMHKIQTQTHLGVHAEAAYKYDAEGADLAQMPLSAYLGEAVACDFSAKESGAAVDAEDFEALGVTTGDIVLTWGDAATQAEQPFITVGATDWLIETGIKAIAYEDIDYSPPGTPLGQGDADCKMLLAGIPVIDGIQGLSQITKRRVFFIALPVRMRRVTAFPTRAIALEPLDG